VSPRRSPERSSAYLEQRARARPRASSGAAGTFALGVRVVATSGAAREAGGRYRAGDQGEVVATHGGEIYVAWDKNAVKCDVATLAPLGEGVVAARDDEIAAQQGELADAAAEIAEVRRALRARDAEVASLLEKLRAVHALSAAAAL
jgi:hypothetical protein